MRALLRSSFFFVFPLVLFSQNLHADFQLLDVIKEFGEKRYIDVPNARLKAGPVNVHPTLRTRTEYDTNILLEDRDGKEDVIFDVLPGVILDLPIQKHRLTVGYEADMEFFSKQRHRTQNDQNQSFFALANLHFPSWYVNVLEQLTETSGRAGTTFSSRIPRIDQSIHPKIGYRWNRLTFETGFRHFYRDFRRQVDDSLDFQLSEWTGVIYLDLFAQLKAFIDYQYAYIDYDDNRTRRGDFNQARIGLEGDLTPNLNVKLRLGPHFRNYEAPAEPDFNSWVADVHIEYVFRDKTTFELDFTRKAVEATFNTVNFYKQHLFGIGVSHELRPNIELFSRMRLYRQNYAERATVGTRTGYRRDDYFNLNMGIKYEPREWLELTGAYELARRDSNFATFDYTDHRFSLATALIY